MSELLGKLQAWFIIEWIQHDYIDRSDCYCRVPYNETETRVHSQELLSQDIASKLMYNSTWTLPQVSGAVAFRCKHVSVPGSTRPVGINVVKLKTHGPTAHQSIARSSQAQPSHGTKHIAVVDLTRWKKMTPFRVCHASMLVDMRIGCWSWSCHLQSDMLQSNHHT